MKRLILVVALLALCGGCTRPSDAKRVLEDAGYTNIHMTGYNWFACSEDDTFHDGFKAVGPTGRAVNGTVCQGLFFKNATIRFQ